MSRSKLLVISLVMLLLALVARIVAIAPNAAKDFGAAPDIVFPAGTAGLPARLSELKGKVVILDFWATWCGPCRMSIPELVHLYEKYKDKGLVVVGVSTDEPETLQNIPDTVEELKINYPIVIGNKIPDLRDKYVINSIPLMYVLDKQGHGRMKVNGYDPNSNLEQRIEELLRE